MSAALNTNKYYDFPLTLNNKIWEQYLSRKLTPIEHNILDRFKTEKIINFELNQLNKQCEKKNMYIPFLTQMTGDCLFEVLNYNKIGNNIEELREGLSFLMYQFKNYKNLFPNNETSLYDMFNCEEQFYVYCHTNKIIHKYTYETMLQDLTNNGSWTKCPTEMILHFISYIYKIKIIIIVNTSDYELVIDAHSDTISDKETIYLGLLGEHHYVPILKIDEKYEKNIHELKYNSCAKHKFLKWAKKMNVIVNKKKQLEYKLMNQATENIDLI